MSLDMFMNMGAIRKVRSWINDISPNSSSGELKSPAKADVKQLELNTHLN